MYLNAFPRYPVAAALLLFLALTTAQAQNIDSLFTVFNGSRGEMRIAAANEIVQYGYDHEYLDSLFTLKTTDEKALVDALVHDVAGSYFSYEKADYRQSITLFRQAVENYETVGNVDAVYLLNQSIGADYVRTGDYENAVTYMMKCYEWEKSTGDNHGLSRTLNDLGVVYSQWQKRDIAIRYFEEALSIERPLNRPVNYANRLASLAKEYSFTDAGKALPLIREALEYDGKIENPEQKEDRMAVHQLIMGDVYYEMDSLKNAENCYQQSLDIFEKNGRIFNIANTLLALGRLQVKAEQYPAAVSTLKKCADIARQNNLARVKFDVYLLLSEAYHHLELDSQSYFYLREYFFNRDSLLKATTQQQINEFQVQYETARKQLEIERQQSEIARHRSRQFLFVGGLAVAVLLVVMLAYIVVLHRRRNRALAETNAIKDKFFSIISHDLKNPAIALRNMLQLLADSADRMDAGVARLLRQSLDSANGLVNLLKNLLNWAKIQTGRDIYHPSQFNLVAALQTDISVVRAMAERKGVALETLMPPAAIINADENMIATVVRNLLANAVKFTAEGGQVSLKISPSGEDAALSPREAVVGHSRHAEARSVAAKYRIAVSDTGTGMTPEQLQNLFRIDRRQTRQGTAGEQSSGLGLIVCNEMLQKNGSTLKVESETGKGSRFWFEI